MRDQKHSVFTYHLLEALRGNTTSAQTRTITITNIFDYVSRKVPETVHQIYGPIIQQIPQINMRGEQFTVALTPQRRNAMAENKEITPEIKIQLADAIFERFNEREFHGLCLRIDTHKDIIDRLEGNL